MLYWLLNERRLPFLPLPPALFTIEQENDALNRRMNGEPLPPPKNGSDALKRIVLKACAYHPKDRYPSAAAMRADLERLSERAQVNTVQPPDGSYSFSKEKLRERTGVGAVYSYKPEPKPQPQPQPKPQPEPKPQPKKESDEETMRAMRRKLENLDRVKVPSKPSVLGIVIILFVSAVFGYFGSQSLSRFGAEGGFWNVVGTFFYYGIAILLLIVGISEIVALAKINSSRTLQVNPDKSVTVHLPNDGCRYALAVNEDWDDAYVLDGDRSSWVKLPVTVKLCRLKPQNNSYDATLVCEKTIL